MAAPLTLASLAGVAVLAPPRVGVGISATAPTVPASLQPADLASFAAQHGEASALSFVSEQTGLPTGAFVGPNGNLQVPWAAVTKAAVEKLGLPPGCAPPLNVNGSSASSFALACGAEVAATWIAGETGITFDFSRWTNPDGSINWTGAGEDAASAVLSFELGAGITVDLVNADGSVNWSNVASDAGAIVGVLACDVLGVSAIVSPICGVVGSEVGEGVYVAANWIAGEAVDLANAISSLAGDIAGLFSEPAAPAQPSDQPINAALTIQGAATWWTSHAMAYVTAAEAYRALALLAASMVQNVRAQNAAFLGPNGFAATVWMLESSGAVFPPRWTEQLGRVNEGGTWTTELPAALRQENPPGTTLVFTEAEFFRRYVTPLPEGAPTPVFDTLAFCKAELEPYGFWTPYFPPLPGAGVPTAAQTNFVPRSDIAQVTTMYLTNPDATSPGPGVVTTVLGTAGQIVYANAKVGAASPTGPGGDSRVPPGTIARQENLPPFNFSVRDGTVTLVRDSTWNQIAGNPPAQLPGLLGALRDTCLNSWVQAVSKVRSSTRQMARLRKGGTF